MPNEFSLSDLRPSASLLTTEWWLLLGGIAGYLVYAIWVAGTGVGISFVAPPLRGLSVGTISGTTISALDIVGAVMWVLVPAVVTVWLFERQLSNTYGNLASHYRLDNPSVLLALPGAVMIVVTIVALVVGLTVPVAVAMLFASVLLFVRTIAYGRRVYSVSSRLLFKLFEGISAMALAAGWLLHARTLPGTAGQQVSRTAVGDVVETGLAVTGATSETVLGILIAIPAIIAGLYLVVQVPVAYRIRSTAPLAQPTKRAEQRFPIMPPVSNSERPGGTETVAEDSNDETDNTETPGRTTESATQDNDSDTRVFTPETPGSGEAATQVVNAGEDDSWIDDTDIFATEQQSSTSNRCSACSESVEEDAAFCPNCGERIAD